MLGLFLKKFFFAVQPSILACKILKSSYSSKYVLHIKFNEDTNKVDAGSYQYKTEDAPRLERGKGGPTLPSKRVPAVTSKKVRTS